MHDHNPPTIQEMFATNKAFTARPGVCPHCGSCATFKLVQQTQSRESRLTTDELRRTIIVHIGKCDACACVLFGTEEDRTAVHHSAQIHWPFEVLPDRAPPGLQATTKKTYDEARHVLGISPDAAAVLTRRCMQDVIRSKLEITKKRLFDEIEEAAKREELSQPTRKTLHHIREIGNWSAHPCADEASAVIEVTREESMYTIEALEMLFGDLYVAPARAESMKTHLLGRKAGQEADSVPSEAVEVS